MTPSLLVKNCKLLGENDGCRSGVAVEVLVVVAACAAQGMLAVRRAVLLQKALTRGGVSAKVHKL